MKRITYSSLHVLSAIFFLAITTSTISLKAASMDDSLVIRLRFDGDSLAEPDSFLTAEDNPDEIRYSEDSIDGMALDLQAENGPYVMVIRPPEIENHFTISMWIKLPEGNPEILRGVFSWGPLSGVEGEAHGFFVSEFQRFLTIQNFGSTSNTGHGAPIGEIDVSQWNHIAYTYAAVRGIPVEHKLFVNGKVVISTDNINPIINNRGHNILIGVNPVGGYEVFPGLIDDFRLYDRPLTQSEVFGLYHEFMPLPLPESDETGLVLRLPFNGEILAEPDLFVAEKIGRQNNIYGEGIDGQSVILPNALDSHVILHNPPSIEEHFTVSMWIKMDGSNLSALRGLMSWGSNDGSNRESHGIFITPLNQIAVILNWNTQDEVRFTSRTLSEDLSQWNHFSYSYSRDEKSLVVYLNGKPIIRQRALWRFHHTGLPIQIGSNPVGGKEIFPGSIDDFRLYNRPLTQSEVQALIDEHIPRLSIERIDQGSILTINNPKKQLLEVLTTGDFQSWESAYETTTSKTEEFFFDNQHQADSHRFYYMRPKVR